MTLLPFALLALGLLPAHDPPDVLGEDLARYVAMLGSGSAAERASAVEGLAWMRAFRAEPEVLALASDPDASVRRQVAWALGRMGRAASAATLAAMLGDPDAGVGEHARASLGRLLASDDIDGEIARGLDPGERESHYVAMLTGPERFRALRALRCFGGPATEAAVLSLAGSAQPGLSAEEATTAVQVLERVGTEASVPWLAAVSEWLPEAAWALGEIGGPAAEEALRKGLARFGTYDQAHVLNLDRLHSAQCAVFVPALVNSYGCITYRGQPENVSYDPTPLQRACTNLIRRAGRDAEVIDDVLDELEDCPDPAALAPDLRPLMEQLRQELLPGFVRNDGWVTSQPLAAMAQLVADRTLAPRLIPLLDHPAFVPRVYVALALGNLGATEATPALVDQLELGYPFPDATTAVSGKHFGDSQTVRWKGFLCMALGRTGGEEARAALERFAADPETPRDIRYGSVVGLGLLGEPASLPVLERVAREDLVWRVRDEAAASSRAIARREGSAR